MSRRAPGRGDKKQNSKRPPKTRQETISRNLSYLLRHNAENEGVHVDGGGWAVVTDVLNWHKLRSLNVTFAEVQTCVENSEKKRFQLQPNPSPPLTIPSDPTRYPSQWLIRAVQGHSMPTISAEKLLTPVTASDPHCPNLVVHGTYIHLWQKIRKSGGLMPMGRNHIHFATKEPQNMAPIGDPVADATKPEHDGEDKVMSGMRAGATVLIWVDVKRSLEGGVKWWRSENGVYLTEGLEGVFAGEDGGEGRGRRLGFEWVRWVERRGKGEILWRGEGVDVERERRENREGKGGEVKSDAVDKEQNRQEGKLQGLKVDDMQGGRDGMNSVDDELSKEKGGSSKEPVKERWDE